MSTELGQAQTGATPKRGSPKPRKFIQPDLGASEHLLSNVMLSLPGKLAPFGMGVEL
jgi:hypothetical protein